MEMNRVKCLVVLSVLGLFVAAPSLSSILSPAPSPDVHYQWSSDMSLARDSAVRAVADTADVAADSLAVGRKKKKKKAKKEKLPFWAAYPPALLGYTAYQVIKVNGEIKKTVNARMERLRDSLNAVNGAAVEVTEDSLRRVVCPVDTSASLRPAPMTANELSAADAEVPKSVADKLKSGSDRAVPGADKTGSDAEKTSTGAGISMSATNPSVVANDSTAPMKTFRLVTVKCRKSSPTDVSHCNGSGVCAACDGAKRRYVISQGEARLVDCDNCGGTGLCPGCKARE